jgi:C4-dicarboxylate-binding protein DctP
MAKETYEFKISVETIAEHPKNKGLRIFIRNLEEISNGRFKADLYEAAQLYKGVEVMKAITLGTLDMGVPGSSFMDQYDPNWSLIALPMFYGQPTCSVGMLLDNKRFASRLNANLEEKLQCKIPGNWYGWLTIYLYTTKTKVTKMEDLRGLKIRYSGFPKANSARLRAMGANPVPLPWPDVSMALMRGTLDGLYSAMTSVYRAKLVDVGMKYALRIPTYTIGYIPMVSNRFWNTLPEDLQKLFIECWNDHVPIQREISEKMDIVDELKLKNELEKRGGGIYRPRDEEIVKWREEIMHVQDSLIKEMKIDPDLVRLAKEILGVE